MENIVYYFLIVFGAILVWISCNDLRKLKENNAQWAEIERQSHLYNQDNYAEAEKLVKKLQKIIPFLSKFALLNGVFAIICALLGLVGLFNAISFNLYTLGCWSVFLLFITSAFFIGLHRHSEQDEFFYHLNKRYKKSIYFFMENNTINFSKYIGSTAGKDYAYKDYVIIRTITLFSYNIFLFTFLISFFLCQNFRQAMILVQEWF